MLSGKAIILQNMIDSRNNFDQKTVSILCESLFTLYRNKLSAVKIKSHK